MAKLPGISWLVKRFFFDGDYLTYLPAKEAIKPREKVVLPGVVVDHFIEKAAYRFLMDTCICRESNGCAAYPHDIGCLFIGEAARGINPGLGREVTAEEARALQRRAESLGLVNLVGKNRIDTIWLGVSPGERLLTVCHCCECCCLWHILPDAAGCGQVLHRLEGVQVRVEDHCTGCGDCVPVCFVRAISVRDGSAVIGDQCRGCGRCVITCPHGAITLDFTRDDFFEECILRISSRVDVT